MLASEIKRVFELIRHSICSNLVMRYIIVFFLIFSIADATRVPPSPDSTIEFPYSYDGSVQYKGPSGKYATITGSPFWKFSYEQIISTYEEAGYELTYEGRPKTPYGLGPQTFAFTQAGESILWIPDYGWTLGQDDRIRMHQETLFWVLWKAGVKTMLVGGNSGVADWRSGPDKVETGDVVFPWSYRTQTYYRGLPGTEFEAVWGRELVNDQELPSPFMGEPFSSRLANLIFNIAQPMEGSPFGKVHAQDSLRITLVHPESITFESDFDILYWQTICKTLSENQPDLPPVITIHGDCINPILARMLGIEMAYYHIITNAAQGLSAPGKIEDLDEFIYNEAFNQAALDIEIAFFAELLQL